MVSSTRVLTTLVASLAAALAALEGPASAIPAVPLPPKAEEDPLLTEDSRRLQEAEGPAWMQADRNCSAACTAKIKRYADHVAEQVVCRDAARNVVACEDIYIALVVSMSDRSPQGPSVVLGQLRHIEYINARQELLPGFRIRIDIYDTEETDTGSIDAFIAITQIRDRYAFYFAGDGVSSIAAVDHEYRRAINTVGSLRTNRATQSRKYSAPDVVNFFGSDLARYVGPSIAVAEYVGWKEMAVVTGTELDLDRTIVADYMDTFIQNGKLDSYFMPTVTWDSDAREDIGLEGGAAGALLRSNVRVLMLLLDKDELAYMLCELFKADRTGYVIFTRSVSSDIADPTRAADSDYRSTNNCTAVEINSVGIFFRNQPADWVTNQDQVPVPATNVTCNPDHSSATMLADVMELNRLLYEDYEPEVPMAYGGKSSGMGHGGDPVCLWALAASHMLVSPGGYTVQDIASPSREVHDEMIRFMQNTRITGITGDIFFRGQPHRPMDYIVEFYFPEGGRHPVGYYSADSDRFIPHPAPDTVTWHDNSMGFENAPPGLFPVCPPGQVLVGTACESCAQGEVFHPSRRECVCAPGYHRVAIDGRRRLQGNPDEAPGPGHNETLPPSKICSACPPGTYTPNPMQSTCIDCQAGTFTSSLGSTKCLRCSAGSFSSEVGTSMCTPCNRTFLSAMGANSADECTCPEGSYFFRESPAARAWCKTCHLGLVCPGGNGQPRTAPLYSAGYDGPSRAVAPYAGAHPSYVVKCADLDKCPGDMEMGRCPEHREEIPACGICELGYAEEDGACRQCSSRNELRPLILTCCGACAVVGVLFAYARRDPGVKSQTLLTITISGGLILNTMQVLGAFREISIEWPEPMNTIYQYLKVFAFNVELLNIGCIFQVNSPEVSYLGAIMALPLFVVFLVTCFYIISILPPPLGRKVSKVSVLNTVGLIMLSFYTSLSIISVLPWQCERNPDGTSAVVSNRTVMCWQGGKHTLMLMMSAFAAVFYIGIFISMIAWATFVYPNKVCREGGIAFLHRFHFLFDRFSPQVYYFGLFYCLRNLFIALIPVVFANEVAAQLMLLSLLFASYLTIQAHLWPWRSALPNYLDTLVCFCLIAILVGGALVIETDKGHTVAMVTGFFMIAITAFVAAMVAVFSWSLYRLLFPPKLFGAFICHHKVGAAVMARWLKMEIQSMTKKEIFLDSDNLDRLDVLFETVAFNTSTLIALMTSQLLERIWCAGEITAAVHSAVSIVRVKFEDYHEPSPEFIESLEDIWSEGQKNEVGRLGIKVSEIKDAYRRFKELPSVEVDRTAEWAEQEEALRRAIAQCRGLVGSALQLKRVKLTGALKPADVSVGMLLCGDSSGSENAMTLVVLQRLLQQALQQTVAIVGSSSAELGAQLRHSMCLLPVLTSGVLQQGDFAAALVAAAELKRGIFPIVADKAFSFPGPKFYADLEAGRVFAETYLLKRDLTLLRVHNAYQAMFNNIALHFSPHGSEVLLRTEVSEIARRSAVFGRSPVSRSSTDCSSEWGKGKGNVSQLMTSETTADSNVMSPTLSPVKGVSHVNLSEEAFDLNDSAEPDGQDFAGHLLEGKV